MKIFFLAATVFYALIARAQKDSSDTFIVQQLKATGYAMRTPRALVWFSNRIKDRQKAEAFAKTLDSSIVQIEKFTGQFFDTTYYGTARIEYFVSEFSTVSHVYNGYRHNTGERLPYIFFSARRFAAGTLPYLHETTHLILRPFASLWLREGMAEWVAVQLGKATGEHVAFYASDAKDNEVPALLNDLASTNSLKAVGADGIPFFDGVEERRRFYVLSTSFVQYLSTRLTKAQLLQLYFSAPTQIRLEALLGKPIATIKKDWVAWAVQANSPAP